MALLQVKIAKGDKCVFWDNEEEYRSFSLNTHFIELVSWKVQFFFWRWIFTIIRTNS